MTRKNQICTLNLTADWAPPVQLTACPTRVRLADGFIRLRNIELVRNHRKDPMFQKSAEERIVWRELLDLEVQALDEQSTRRSMDGGAHPD